MDSLLSLQPAARRFIAALSGAAVAALVFGLAQAGAPTWKQSWETVALGMLVAIAWLFPLPISFKTNLYLDTSVITAAILAVEPGQAILLAGAGAAAAHLIRRLDAAQTIFNSSQAMLQAAAGSAVLALGGWEFGGDEFSNPALAVMIFAAAVAMLLITDVAVATMVALQSGVSVLKSWSQTVVHADATDRLSHFGQAGIGLIGAVLLETVPWTIFLLLIPAAAVYVSLARAIEHRKRAEETLRHTEAALAEAQRVSHLGSWEWNLATGDQTWSDEAFRIFGFAPGAFLPTWDVFLRHVHPDDRAAVDQAVHAALYSGERFSLDHRIVLPDETTRILHAEGEVVFDASGEKVRVLGTVQDITERKAAERAREALLASVSHDLKSPLTVIRGHAQLLQMKAKRPHTEPGEIVDGLGKIDAAAARMSAQLTELLDVTRLQMGEELELHRAPMDLVALTRERVALHAQTSRRHEIEVTVGQDELVGEWDRARLERVLDNLIGNAIKYSPSGGRVTVRVECRHDGGARWATARVHDSGVGIPTDDLPRVFDAFHRGGNVGGIPGTGIGLAGSKQIVEQHGGTIDVESVEGQGSTFTVRLPV